VRTEKFHTVLPLPSSADQRWLPPDEAAFSHRWPARREHTKLPFRDNVE
jgi:hypothetical protein